MEKGEIKKTEWSKTCMLEKPYSWFYYTQVGGRVVCENTTIWNVGENSLPKSHKSKSLGGMNLQKI